MAVEFLAVIVALLLLFPSYTGKEVARAVKAFKKEMEEV